MTQRPDDIPEDWIQLEFTVPREQAGWRADLFLSHRIPRLSRTRVQRILKRSVYDGAGKKVKPNRQLFEGERLVVYRPPPDEPDAPRTFNVLYEDADVLAVDKPARLPVHPTARYLLNTLTGLLGERYGVNKPRLAHRIDSETSGIVLCAKTAEAERALKIAFARRKIAKLYFAITSKIPEPRDGRIEAEIGPDTEGPIRVKMACGRGGLGALTEYRVLLIRGERALVACRPRTGRQHQIRVHLAHIGAPIVGDKMYGPDPSLFLDYIDGADPDDIERRAGAPRHFLHAAKLEFNHPTTDRLLAVRCPLPEDMKSALGITEVPEEIWEAVP